MYGSSPLARGLRGAAPRQGVGAGIIPARAGFTVMRNAIEKGEEGSSPLARGLLPVSNPASLSAGIIPARAGFTVGWSITSVVMGDHPRSRGVYESHSQAHHPTQGSSPLARGLPSADPAAISFFRIIPARAGFTALIRTVSSARWDHPRSRGVYRRA